VRAAHSEDTLVGVNIIAEINIINLISVTLVHVTSEDEIQNSLWGKDTKLGQHTKELALGDMATLGDIEVLELRLQVNATVKNSGSIILKILLNLLFFILGSLQVLASSSISILASDRLDTGNRVLIDALLGECEVNGGAELSITEVPITVVSLSK